MASTPSNPAYFSVLLERRWAKGITKVRHLLDEIRRRGYTGFFTHLARFLSPWRSGQSSLEGVEQEEPAPIRVGQGILSSPRLRSLGGRPMLTQAISAIARVAMFLSFCEDTRYYLGTPVSSADGEQGFHIAEKKPICEILVGHVSEFVLDL